MCICLHKPAGVTLPRETYENCFDSNRDGAGFAFANEGRIYHRKGFFTFDEFYDAFTPFADMDVVVHFRIATAGMTDEENCHPWMIEDCRDGFSFAVAHNGILSYKSSALKSDTGHFVDEILGPLLKRDPWFLDHDAGRYVLEETIGSMNKIIVLRSDGKVYILNESKGVRKDQTWFSNHTFEEDRYWGHFRGSRRIVKGFNRSDYGTFGSDWDHEDWPSYMRSNPAEAIVTGTSTRLPHLTVPRKSDTKLLTTSTVEVGKSRSMFPYLTRDQRKKLVSCTARQFASSGMSFVAMIDSMRSLYRDTHPDAYNLPDAEIDLRIVKENFDGFSSDCL